MMTVSQQSTFRRYAANVFSPFFSFLLFSMCHYAINMHLGLLVNNNKHKH